MSMPELKPSIWVAADPENVAEFIAATTNGERPKGASLTRISLTLKVISTGVIPDTSLIDFDAPEDTEVKEAVPNPKKLWHKVEPDTLSARYVTTVDSNVSYVRKVTGIDHEGYPKLQAVMRRLTVVGGYSTALISGDLSQISTEGHFCQTSDIDETIMNSSHVWAQSSQLTLTQYSREQVRSPGPFERTPNLPSIGQYLGEIALDQGYKLHPV